jgi:dienelactone hydrolase
VAFWYPAAATGSGPELRFRDLLAATVGEAGLRAAKPGEVDAALAGWSGFLTGHDVSPATAAAWLEAPLGVFAAAAPADRRPPLVLVAQGDRQSAPDQAVLCAFLASHGFAVATMPSPSSLDGEMSTEAEIVPRAEEQAADLAFVAAELERRGLADATRIGVVGHSFGARGALFYVMREPRAVALVSLDGGIGTALGAAAMRASPMWRPARLRASVLHCFERLDPFMAPDLGLLREAAGERLELLESREMHHIHFSTLGFAAAAWPDLGAATGAGDRLAGELASVSAAVLDHLRHELPPTP